MDLEEGAIRQTLQYFFDGFDNLDAILIKKAFHPEAQTRYIANNGSVAGMQVSDWDESMQKARENPDHPLQKETSRKNIIYIDVTGTAAAAKVEWVFTGFMFTDYYNLLKIDGRWYIMNKAYHTTVFGSNG